MMTKKMNAKSLSTTAAEAVIATVGDAVREIVAIEADFQALELRAIHQCEAFYKHKIFRGRRWHSTDISLPLIVG